ncbi:MAG TPA: helix-turn-helix transcriptional regulator [Caulobacterales bacterium]|nr:helix-turn-helix transcriptional regulator [Caulobacterales bacterium]
MPKSAFTDAYAILLDILVALRKKQGVTQVELARRLGKPQPFVSYYERGERRIDVIEFYAIVRALDADPVKVFAGLAKRLPKRVDI